MGEIEQVNPLRGKVPKKSMTESLIIALQVPATRDGWQSPPFARELSVGINEGCPARQRPFCTLFVACRVTKRGPRVKETFVVDQANQTVMLNKKEISQLVFLMLLASVFAIVLRTGSPLGTNAEQNPIVQEVQRDRTSPAFENARANVTLTVFTDYQCGACRSAYPRMKRVVAEDGKVRVVVKDWPIFGPASELAAEVAIASSFQGVYPKVHDRLMTGPVAGDRALRTAVESSGGSWTRVQRDLIGRRHEIRTQLATNRAQAFGLGLGGTPGYLIGPYLVRGALSGAEFKRVLADARQTR